MITSLKKKIHQFLNLAPWRINGLHLPYYIRNTYRGKYEPETSEYISSSLRGGGKTFVDVGANIGYFSKLAEKAGAIVIAFEPDPRNLRFLRRNVKEARIFDCAAGDTERKTILNLDYDVSLTALSFSRAETVKRIPISVKRLDDLVADADIIKIDVEGDELSVLVGGGKLLARRHPVIVCENNDPAAVQGFLKEKGYRLLTVFDEKNAVYVI